MRPRRRSTYIFSVAAIGLAAVAGCGAKLPLTGTTGQRAGCAEWGEPLMFSGTSWVQSATTRDTARSEGASKPTDRQPSACNPGRQGW